MPAQRKKQSAPAPMPHPSRPPLQAPSPPANPNADRLTVSDIEVLLDPKYGGQITLPTFRYDSQENRAIMDAVRNRGIAPAVAIANAEARAASKGNVKGPSGQAPGIGAALPTVKTPPRVPTPPPRVPTPAPPVPTRPPSPPRAPSPSASVLSSKRPISPGSSSSGPSVAAILVCGSDDSSMALDYEDATTPRPASPADEEHLDSNESVEAVVTLINSAIDIFKALSSSQWKNYIIDAFPSIMDGDINRIHSTFMEKIPILHRILPPAVEVPASAVDAPATRLNPRDAQPPADSAKSKPPKKKVRVDPAPSVDVTPPARAPLMEVDEPAVSPPASGKAPTNPLPIPSSKRAPPPSSAPSVSFRAPSAPRKRRQGKHTAHGASRRAIILTPPADSPVTAASFTPEVINSLNQLLKKDVKSDVVLTHASVEGKGICIAASQVPSPAEIVLVLKHVRRIFPSPNVPIGHTPITLTSYLKIVDIPHVPASSKEWALKQHEAFTSALNKSPVGASLAKLIKHKPRFMRASPHSDSCWAWVDIHDTVSGSNARTYISKFVSISGTNCQIKGARPHSGSVHCARCQRWGHHSDQCRAKCARCSLCSGPHSEANHSKCVDAKRIDVRQCANCTAAKRPADKRSHSATDAKDVLPDCLVLSWGLLLFIGYPAGYKGWKFYNPVTKRTVISERADFDERYFPGTSKAQLEAVPSFARTPDLLQTPNDTSSYSGLPPLQDEGGDNHFPPACPKTPTPSASVPPEEKPVLPLPPLPLIPPVTPPQIHPPLPVNPPTAGAPLEPPHVPRRTG
ncbi:hypothetical protein AGABI2DRAFT_145088 [Agaricus bisporus var. bisporus H97]|uniref:hypothetical protein n=1 Tax=Agaricus bisporus var. bisporus (strain H97 / ATCC MYA-4626 / FGSC 10389) TaxID=936046 RepID=UPI00029F672C|nr:hypothetical protein AGABI2DRAFT_145088 [Agaricus bisporus var. bisporus H97]EKV44582.1 hypothetical protein AGABI2DRAFT_145088 [Agaricus bisporus var. bisporus H97]